MALQHLYVRRTDYQPGETVDLATVSIDIGPKNFVIERLSLLAPTERIVCERAVVLDLRGQNQEQDASTIGNSLRTVFNGSDYLWMWEPPVPVVTERQVDHLASVAGAESRYRPPINFAIYCMVQTMVNDRIAPMLMLSEAAWQFLEEKGVDPMADLFVPQGLSWTPRSGSQKSGLEGFHEAERKEKTLEKGPDVMRENKDYIFANWTDDLQPKNRDGTPKKSEPKPKEDVCDAYLQGHHFLRSQLEGRKKEVRKTTRAANAQAKRENLAARRKAREEMLRKKAEEKKSKEAEKARKKAERERKKKQKESESRGKKRKRSEASEPTERPTYLPARDANSEEEEEEIPRSKTRELLLDDLEVIGLVAPPKPIELLSDDDEEEEEQASEAEEGERPHKRLRTLAKKEAALQGDKSFAASSPSSSSSSSSDDESTIE
jgi:hypothetical protein